ncbi:MAG: hypothetical protein IK010_02095 [Bacteroidales bacterium]|nr:hypothetical protein [Bacteroidales bacterium]
MKKALIPVLLAAILMVGCEQTRPVVREKQIRAAETQAGVITEPMVLEIESISAQTLTDSTVFNISMYNNTAQLNADLPEYKQYALEKFVFKSEFDMIVNTTFYTYTRNDSRELVVVVKGYGVKYKKMRKATPDDVWMSNFVGRK